MLFTVKALCPFSRFYCGRRGLPKGFEPTESETIGFYSDSTRLCVFQNHMVLNLRRLTSELPVIQQQHAQQTTLCRELLESAPAFSVPR